MRLNGNRSADSNQGGAFHEIDFRQKQTRHSTRVGEKIVESRAFALLLPHSSKHALQSEMRYVQTGRQAPQRYAAVR